MLMFSKRNIRIKSYNDRVQVDTGNKSFYIYYIGKNDNKLIYQFGETMDTDMIELRYKTSLRYYEKVKEIPIEDQVYGKKHFEDHLKNQNLILNDNMFNLNSSEELNDLLCKVDEIFKVYNIK